MSGRGRRRRTRWKKSRCSERRPAGFRRRSGSGYLSDELLIPLREAVAGLEEMANPLCGASAGTDGGRMAGRPVMPAVRDTDMKRDSSGGR